MATAFDVCVDALDRIGANAANSEPSNEDIEITARALNTLIDSMSNIQQNIFSVAPYRFLTQGGKQDYLLGPATDDAGNPTNADWVIARPMRIEEAVLMAYAPIVDVGPPIVIGETSGTLFLGLTMVNFYDWSSLSVRYLNTTWPTTVYDNGGYPCRTISLWPVPQGQLAIELWLWEPLTTYSTLTQELNLPPGYQRYLTLKLAMEIAPTFGKSVTDTLRLQAAEAENNVRILNQITTVSQPSPNGRSLSRRTPDYLRNNGKYTRVPRIWG